VRSDGPDAGGPASGAPDVPDARPGAVAESRLPPEAARAVQMMEGARRRVVLQGPRRPTRRLLGIRAQVLAALAVALGLGLAVSYGVTTRLAGSALVEARVARAHQVAGLVAERLEGLPARGFARRRALRAMRRAVAPDTVWILGPRGLPVDDAQERAEEFGQLVSAQALRELAAGQGGGSSVASERALRVTTPGGSPVLLTQVPLAAPPGHSVLVVTSLAPTERRLKTIADLLFLFSLVALGLAVVPGYLLLGRLVVRPLQRLVNHLERVAERGEAPPLDAGRGASVEVARLFESFTAMTERLQAGRARIEAQLDELRFANRELEQAHETLVVSEKLATVGTLAAGVAHEIGNPIAILQGYIEILRAPDMSAEERAQALDVMDGSVGRISTIIRDLLDFARPVDDDERTCDAVAAVRAAVKLVEPQPRFRGVDVRVRAPQGAVVAGINEGRLEQVVLNLLLNAADAMDGRGAIDVAVHVVRDEEAQGAEYVEVVVADEGPGLDPETARQVFDPFFTTKDPGAGTGLGLAICHNIVTSYGGTIDVESEPGQGATFRVRVPTEGGGAGEADQHS